MGLELDELVYTRIVRYFKNKKNNNPLLLERQVAFEELKPVLTVIARAVTGKAIEVFPAESEGGYKNDNFFLPVAVSFFPSRQENKEFYLYRLLYLCWQNRLGLNWSYDEQDLQLSQKMAKDAAGYVLEPVFNEFPTLRPVFEKAKAALEQQGNPEATAWLYGKWMYSPYREENETLDNFSGGIKTPTENRVDTILKAIAAEGLVSLEIDLKQQEDYVLLHNFEKVETAEEFTGVWRDFDGDDQLDEHQDSLEEIGMKFTVRVDDPTHSIYEADFIENATVAESAERDHKGLHFLYDEWDFKKARYKQGFCKVYPKRANKLDTDYYHNTLQQNRPALMQLRKLLTSVNNKTVQLRKQQQGDGFDTDALTDFMVDFHSRKTPSEHIFYAKRKKEKELSILLLLDTSLSSDGYAAGNRIIDIEKQSAILFGEILNEFNVDFAIDSFYSKTRNNTTYISLKDFDENWRAAKYRVGTAEPAGYTRIGAALRHAGARMDSRNTKNKWIILLSDGKPNDYDRYEGSYGLNDVKQALRELNSKNIKSYALAVEAQAKYYLPQMFGVNHFQMLTNTTGLLQALVKLFHKIKFD